MEQKDILLSFLACFSLIRMQIQNQIANKIIDEKIQIEIQTFLDTKYLPIQLNQNQKDEISIIVIELIEEILQLKYNYHKVDFSFFDQIIYKIIKKIELSTYSSLKVLDLIFLEQDGEILMEDKLRNFLILSIQKLQFQLNEYFYYYYCKKLNEKAVWIPLMNGISLIFAQSISNYILNQEKTQKMVDSVQWFTNLDRIFFRSQQYPLKLLVQAYKLVQNCRYLNNQKEAILIHEKQLHQKLAQMVEQQYQRQKTIGQFKLLDDQLYQFCEAFEHDADMVIINLLHFDLHLKFDRTIQIYKYSKMDNFLLNRLLFYIKFLHKESILKDNLNLLVNNFANINYNKYQKIIGQYNLAKYMINSIDLELLYLLDFNEYNQKTLDLIQKCITNSSKNPFYPNQYDHYFYKIVMQINPNIIQQYGKKLDIMVKVNSILWFQKEIIPLIKENLDINNSNELNNLIQVCSKYRFEHQNDQVNLIAFQRLSIYNKYYWQKNLFKSNLRQFRIFQYDYDMSIIFRLQQFTMKILQFFQLKLINQRIQITCLCLN